jgi:mono/diheme cytochrome c family protein
MFAIVMLSTAAASLTARAAQAPAPADTGPGKAIYEARCLQCHGASGRGDGPAAPALVPRPRDFTSGKFKFRSTDTGSLPTDDDLIRSVRIGLPGTSMPGWEPFLSAGDILAVVTYVKTFSPRFASATTQPVVLAARAAASPAGSTQAGRVAYERLKCASCHGTDGTGSGAIAEDLKDDWGRPIAATRLTEPWTFRGGATAGDVFLRLRTGMNGSPMPSFHEAAGDRDLMDAAIYVTTLGRKPVWEMNAAEVDAHYQSLAAEAERNPVPRGKYLVEFLGCSYCHTPIREDGSLVDELLYAGGQRWRLMAYGDFVSYNLTSDKETGLGSWTDDQIKTLLTRGVRRDGTRMLPFPMPWTSYANLKPADLNAVVAFLRTLPPVSNRIPPPQSENIVTYLYDKFRMLILKTDLPLLTYAGNSGTAAPRALASNGGRP